MSDAPSDSIDTVELGDFDANDEPSEPVLPEGPLVEQLCLPLAQLVCEKVMPCDCANRAGVDDGLASALCVAQAVDRCLSDMRWFAGSERTEELLESGQVGIDSDGVEACLEAFGRRVRHCRSDGTVVGLSEPLLYYGGLGCHLAVASTEAVGEPCALGEDGFYGCASGDGVCYDGICQPVAGDGDECGVGVSQDCGPGFYCNIDEICAPVGSLEHGSSCGGHSECADGLWCFNRMCRSLPQEGEHCSPHGCAPGLECLGVSAPTCEPVLHDDCYTEGLDPQPAGFRGCGWSAACRSNEPPRCLPLLQTGEICRPGDRCEPGLTCSLQNDGEVRCAPVCNEDGDCAGDDLCVFGSCASRRPIIGEECGVDEPNQECADGLWCEEFVQAEWRCSDEYPVLGEDCTAASECAEGLACNLDQNKCIEVPGLDENCLNVYPTPCENGLRCNSGSCVERLGEGEECDFGGGCQLGLACLRDPDQDRRFCSATLPAEGEICEPEFDGCAEGLYCAGGTCHLGLPEAGEVCTDADNLCAEGLVCARRGRSRQCWPLPEDEGDSCPFLVLPELDICPDETFCGCENSVCVCDDEVCEEPACRRYRESGDSCVQQWECGPEAWCLAQEDGTSSCVELGVEGEACPDFDSDSCAEGLFCGGPAFIGTCELDVCDLFTVVD